MSLIIDSIVIALVVAYAFFGYARGALRTTVEGAGFLVAFLGALAGYQGMAQILNTLLPLPAFVWQAISFVFLAVCIEAVCQVVSVVFYRIISSIAGEIPPSLVRFDRGTGALMGSIAGAMIGTFLLMLLLALPLSRVLKDAITASTLGSNMTAAAQSLEQTLTRIWGEGVKETLTFWTLPSMGEETIALGFRVSDPRPLPTAESDMLQLLNLQRKEAGLPPLRNDSLLQEVGRLHAKDMLMRGYFSHTAYDGRSPFDRMLDAGVSFVTAGENLALSASPQLAMQGLMQSPGHRANILSPLFGRVGIGAVDAGSYGILFTQEFAN